MSRLLDGEVVLVTGGAQGIGRAIVDVAVREGAAVGVLDVDRAGLRALTEEVQGAVAVCACDVAREDDVRAAVPRLAAELGAATVLVNNAGRNAYAEPTAMTQEEWEAVFSVDLKAAWLCAKYVLPAMIAAGRGAVVNISSLHARLTTTGMFPYAAAKSGLIGLTRSLALEVARHGIRVNAVSPGYTRTALVEETLRITQGPDAFADVDRAVPLGRMATPEDVAEVVCFVASSRAAYVTGAEWPVDGGLGSRFAS